MERFSDGGSAPKRALQAWLILIGCATNRQTLTYTGLSQSMFGHPAPGVLGQILGHIAAYCEANNLPQLNVLVVRGNVGAPGHAIPLAEDLEPAKRQVNFDEHREAVYRQDWYNIVPPAIQDLEQAWRQHLEGRVAVSSE